MEHIEEEKTNTANGVNKCRVEREERAYLTRTKKTKYEHKNKSAEGNRGRV